MSSVSYAITSETRVKDKLGITVATHDTVIKRLLYGVTDFIERKCGGVSFKKATQTNEVYDGSDLTNDDGKKRFLKLKNAPLTSTGLTSFQYATGPSDNLTWNDFTASDYQTHDSMGVIEVFGGLPRGTRNIRATYEAGYDIDFTDEFEDTAHTLPYELSELADRLIIRQFNRMSSEHLKQESFKDSTQTYWDGLLRPEDKEIIANFSRQTIL